MNVAQDTILIIDFGSQYTKLIARRLREGGYYSHILSCNNTQGIKDYATKGIILAGSHRSVNPKDEELAKMLLRDTDVPLLGICYGMQLLAQVNGGKVAKGESGEYGAGRINLVGEPKLLSDKIEQVWFSHWDEVVELPNNLSCTARSDDGVIAAIESDDGRIYGLQFHPEASHTPNGEQVLWRFADLCNCSNSWQSDNIIRTIVEDIQGKVKTDDKALIALSGGVDSTVMAVLAQQVFGKNILPIFVDNGLLRKGEADYVVASLQQMDIPVVKVDASAEFLDELAGITDPEEKRKIIGRLFIEIFESRSKELGGADWLVQGTIYPDVIESSGDDLSVAQVIKSHHNVGGLPETMSLALWEPLRILFKDEVRKIGAELGVPAKLLGRHPFPGPGLAVRVLGEIKEEYLEILREADAIFIEELRQAGLYDEVSQAFSVFLPLRSVGVIGDARSYGYIIALRAVVTSDFMTAETAHLPSDLLAKVAGRIMNQVDKVSRVVFDYSSKPPATIEWE